MELIADNRWVLDSLEEAEKTDAHELMRRLDKASEKARYVGSVRTVEDPGIGSQRLL